MKIRLNPSSSPRKKDLTPVFPDGTPVFPDHYIISSPRENE